MTHLYASAPQSNPHVVRRRATPAAVQRVGREGGPPVRRLDTRLSGVARQQAVLQLQRQHGNRHVQSLLGQHAVQRAADEALLTAQANGEEDELAMTAQAQADEEELAMTAQAEGDEEELAMTAQADHEDDEMAMTAQAQADEEELAMTAQANGEEDELAMTAQAQGEGEEEELAMTAQAQEEDELAMTAQAQADEEELAMTAQAQDDEEIVKAAQAQADEEELAMTAQAQEEDELAMTAQARGDRGDTSGSRSSRANVFRLMRAQKGSGAGMDMPTLQRFNAAFGQSFDHVRIHTDGPADAINRDMKARAITTGSDIFFRAGAYTPGTPEGDHLLAHELTHVVQQGQGAVPAGHQSSGGVAGRTPADPFERQAEATADAMTGKRPGGSGALPAVQRLAQP